MNDHDRAQRAALEDDVLAYALDVMRTTDVTHAAVVAGYTALHPGADVRGALLSLWDQGRLVPGTLSRHLRSPLVSDRCVWNPIAGTCRTGGMFIPDARTGVAWSCE